MMDRFLFWLYLAIPFSIIVLIIFMIYTLARIFEEMPKHGWVG